MFGKLGRTGRGRSVGAVGLAVTALLLVSTGVRADKPVVRYLNGSDAVASPAALARAKPVSLPQLSVAKMKAAGLINADGTVRQATAPAVRTKRVIKMLNQGNAGGPAMEPFQVMPSAPATTAPAVTLPRDGSSQLAPQVAISSDTLAPMNYGSDAEWPFTTARVENGNKAVNSKTYPYRAVGKLFILLPDGTPYGHCSASLIAKGVIVTAAHCVAVYGQGFMNANFVFYAGFYNGRAVAKSAARAVVVPDTYLNGTDCIGDSPICYNDVALIVLADSRGRYIGSKTGWLGVGYDGTGFNSTGAAQITQLGYPAGIDYGAQMIRNDSLGQIYDSSFANNTIIGSQMTAGSSGGPWVDNFGPVPVLNAAWPGYSPSPNMVLGVTSWGSPSTPLAVMGASPFTSGNIAGMYAAACSYFPLACAP